MAKQLDAAPRNFIGSISLNRSAAIAETFRVEGCISDPNAANNLDRTSKPVSAAISVLETDTWAAIKGKMDAALKAEAGLP